jgi:hypothetical protein
MVYFVLPSDNSKNNITSQIIEFAKKQIKSNSIDYRILFLKKHIIEEDFKEIKDTDIVFWESHIAAQSNNRKYGDKQ